MVFLFGLLIACRNTKDGGYCGNSVIDISRSVVSNHQPKFGLEHTYLKAFKVSHWKLNLQELLRMLFRLAEVDIEKFQQKPPWNQIQMNRGYQSQKP